MKAIIFDMDGTIADLYSVENWFTKLRSFNPEPYVEAKPMWNMEELVKVLNSLRHEGWEVRIVTWLSKDSNRDYDNAVRQAKREWLDRYDFPYDHFHGVRYGATKADSVRKAVDYGILIDDNAKVRHGWHMGATIDPNNCDLIEALTNLLARA